MVQNKHIWAQLLGDEHDGGFLGNHSSDTNIIHVKKL